MTIWRKSTKSQGTSGGGDCVEMAALSTTVGIRDSKNPEAGHIELDRTNLAGLIGKIKEGGLNL